MDLLAVAVRKARTVHCTLYTVHCAYSGPDNSGRCRRCYFGIQCIKFNFTVAKSIVHHENSCRSFASTTFGCPRATQISLIPSPQPSSKFFFQFVVFIKKRRRFTITKIQNNNHFDAATTIAVVHRIGPVLCVPELNIAQLHHTTRYG